MAKFTIPRSDLRRETFFCGGKGGQNQNKTETGVRWIHVPTGIRAEGRSERSQKQNSDSAYALLCAKLLRLILSRREAERQDAYEAKADPSFGSQIRTYRDVGERDVTDHRTGVVGSFDSVVRRGDIDRFLAATLRNRLSAPGPTGS